MLLRLWGRPAAAAPIRPLADPPLRCTCSPKKKKDKLENKGNLPGMKKNQEAVKGLEDEHRTCNIQQSDASNQSRWTRKPRPRRRQRFLHEQGHRVPGTAASRAAHDTARNFKGGKE